MKTKLLSEVLERIESWPAQAQDQLAEIALDIDAGLKDVVHEPTAEELANINRGLHDAEQGRLGLHWEEIGEDISIAGLLDGRGDMTRQPVGRE